jgi:hypothetical protein
MSLDLEPGQYLEMLKAEHEEHKKNPLSVRKVITCCELSKMPDIVFTEYTGLRSPQSPP